MPFHRGQFCYAAPKLGRLLVLGLMLSATSLAQAANNSHASKDDHAAKNGHEAPKAKDDHSPLKLKSAQEKSLVTDAQREEALRRISDPYAPPAIVRGGGLSEDAVEKLPPSLRTEEAQKALANRTELPIYSHNPTLGPDTAPITVVIMTDLDCDDCSQLVSEVTHLRKDYPKTVRIVHKNLPQSPYAIGKMAAFYGKLAQRQGHFWEFRDKLATMKDYKVDDLNNALLSVGVDLAASQRLVRQSARDIYRELDADVQQAQNLSLHEPPLMFVNGVRMGKDVPFSALDALIHYELERKQGTASLHHKAGG